MNVSTETKEKVKRTTGKTPETSIPELIATEAEVKTPATKKAKTTVKKEGKIPVAAAPENTAVAEVETVETSLAESDITVDVQSRSVSMDVPTDLIDRSVTQPRKTFVEAEIEELASSIKARGLLQAILLRPKADRYELVFGERRWRAHVFAGMTAIRAGVAELSDEEVFDIQVHENLHRKDLQPMEEAESYAHLLATVRLNGLPLTEEQLAFRVKKTLKYVANRLLLNRLIDEAKEDLRQGLLPEKLALELATYEQEAQTAAYRYCFESKFDNGVGRSVPVKTRPVNLKSLKEDIKANVLLELKTAPFDIKSPELRPDRLTCPECPQRTGANLLFFEMSEDGDACMNPGCFELKTQTFIQIQKRNIVVGGMVERAKKDYSERIVKAKDAAAKVTDPTDRQIATAKAERLGAELNEIEKNGFESPFAKFEAGNLENLVAKVPMLSESWYSSDKSILGTQDYKTIGNSTQKCSYSETGVMADGKRAGKPQEFCRSKSCKKHQSSSSNSTANRDVKTGEELKARKFQLLNIRAANKTRVKVIRESKDKLGTPESFWSNKLFQRLITATLLEYMSSHSNDHRVELVVQLLKVDYKQVLRPANRSYRADEDAFAIADKLAEQSDEFLMKLTFLLLTSSFGENRYENNDVSNHSVDFLVKMLGIDYALLDAESRIELCNAMPDYKKYLLIAEKHLKSVKEAKPEEKEKLEAPNFWA